MLLVSVAAGRCLHTVQHHTDYVTCLAASEATGKLLSAGLHSEVIMYDMQVRAEGARNGRGVIGLSETVALVHL